MTDEGQRRVEERILLEERLELRADGTLYIPNSLVAVGPALLSDATIATDGGAEPAVHLRNNSAVPSCYVDVGRVNSDGAGAAKARIIIGQSVEGVVTEYEPLQLKKTGAIFPLGLSCLDLAQFIAATISRGDGIEPALQVRNTAIAPASYVDFGRLISDGAGGIHARVILGSSAGEFEAIQFKNTGCFLNGSTQLGTPLGTDQGGTGASFASLAAAVASVLTAGMVEAALGFTPASTSDLTAGLDAASAALSAACDAAAA